MSYNKYLNASPNSKPWKLSVILSIAMIVSFFLPWWGASGRVSTGSFSFSNSFSASPMDQFEGYYPWFIYSILCLVFAYKRWWFAILPAFVNLKMASSIVGLFGEGYSSSYSGYGGSFSGSAGLSFGFYIFLFASALYAIINIGEVFKFILKVTDPAKMNQIPSDANVKSTSSVKEGFTTPKAKQQNQRTLEELKHAKELLDIGAITQGEFEEIKQQALGSNPIITDKEKAQLYDKMEKEKQRTIEQSKPKLRPIPVETFKKSTPIANKKSRSKIFLVIGVSVLILSTAAIVYFFTSHTSHEKEKDDLSVEVKSDADYDAEMLEGDDKANSEFEKDSAAYTEAEYERQQYENQVASQTETISRNDYGIFADDNISIDSLEAKVKKFNSNSGINAYSTYSNHTYAMDINTPAIDLARDWEPANISTGFQRKYFTESESVAVQIFIRDSEVESEIHLHPNGEIYTIKNLVFGKPDGYCKYVDMEKYVILEGNYEVGKMTGFWNNPIMGNFNMSDPNLTNEYPGIMDKTICLIKWYRLSKDERVDYMR